MPAALLPLEPTPYVSAHWTVPRVRNALTMHELGDFSESAKLAEFIRRDPLVFQSLDTRVLGMLGLPFSLDPSEEGDQRKARKVAADVRLWWRKRMRKSQLAKILRWGLLMGFCPGTIAWDEDAAGRMLPRPHVYHPQWARWVDATVGTGSVQRRGFTLQTTKGVVPLETGTGNFFLFSPGGDDQPWMEGAIRALAIPVLIRWMAERDWARASEIYGLGVRRVKVPDDASKAKAIAAFLRDVRNLANEPTLKVPEGFDLAIDIVAASDGKGFEALMNTCNTAIVGVLLGQVLTSQSGGGGSYSLAKEAVGSTHDRYEADVENLIDFVHTEFLEPYAERNEGDRNLAPSPYWDTDPPEDKAVMAARMMNVATAVRTFKDAGLPVDVRALLEGLEIPMLPPAKGDDMRRGQLRDVHLTLGVLRVDEVRADLGYPLWGEENGGNDIVTRSGPKDPDAPDTVPAPPFPPPPPESAPPEALAAQEPEAPAPAAE